MRYPNGRTMAEAKLAGDWFQLRRTDTGKELSFPGCGGLEESLEAARRYWPAGTTVEASVVLPRSTIGFMFLGEAVLVTL